MSIANTLLWIVGIYTVMFGYVCTRRRSAVTILFALIILVSIAWDVTYYLELILPAVSDKVVPHLARFLFLPWLAMLWLLLLRELFGVCKTLPRWVWYGLAAFNIAVGLAAVTASYHQLFQYDFTIQSLWVGEGLGVLVYKKGIIYRIHEMIAQGLFCWMILLMAMAWRGASPIMKRFLIMLILCVLLPLVCNMQYSMGRYVIPQLNVAPFTTIISSLTLSWLIFRYHVLDIVPVARAVLLDNLHELVFVTDRQNQLVDLNAAALRVIGKSLVEWIGKRPGDLPAPWGPLLNKGAGIHEVSLGNSARWFEFSSPEIQDKRGGIIGQLNILRDVTLEQVRQQRELAFQKITEEKKYLRQQELLIRDLHDGVAGVVAGIGMIAALGLREKDEAKRNGYFRAISDLAGEGSVEVRSLMSTLESRQFLWPDLLDEMRRHGAMLQENHGIAFSLSVTGEWDAEGPGLLAGMSLFRIVKEALHNVVKHSGATRVGVDLMFVDGQMRLTVTDNGSGLAEGSPNGRGVSNMTRRIREMGGDLKIEGQKGMRLEFVAPFPLKTPGQVNADVPDNKGRA